MTDREEDRFASARSAFEMVWRRTEIILYIAVVEQVLAPAQLQQYIPPTRPVFRHRNGSSALYQEVVEHPVAARIVQFSEGAELDLAHSFMAQADLLTDLGQAMLTLTIEAVAQLQYVALTLGQKVQKVLYLIV